MCSSGVWISAMPFARLRHCRPRSLKTFASAAPPVRLEARLVPARSSAATASRTGRSSALEAVAAVVVARLGLDVALREARRERDASRASPATSVAELALVVRARLGGERCTTPGRCSSRCRPGSSRRSRSSRRRAGRGAGRRSPARRPRSRSGPPRATSPRARPCRGSARRSLRGVRRAEDHVADRRGLVVDVADARDEARLVEARRRRRGPTSSFGVKQELDAGVRPPSATTRRRPRASPRPRPCCRRRGSSPPRSGRRRPRRPARSAPSAARCRGARRRRAACRLRAVGSTARVEVPDLEPISGAGVVLVDVEPELAQLSARPRRRPHARSPGGLGIAASSRKSFKAWEVCTYLVVSYLKMSIDAHIPTAAEPLIQASLLGEAVDTGPVAIFVADEQMRYVAVNAYAAELLGYTRAELLELRVHGRRARARGDRALRRGGRSSPARRHRAADAKERKRVPARLPRPRDHRRRHAAVRLGRLADLAERRKSRIRSRGSATARHGGRSR